MNPKTSFPVLVMSTFRRAVRFMNNQRPQSSTLASQSTASATPIPRVAATSTNPMAMWYHSYIRSLKTHPIRSKALTALIVGVAADFIAQKCAPNSNTNNTNTKPRYDYRRTAAFSASCALITAPLYHGIYARLAKSGLSILNMVLVDTFLAAPTWYALYIPSVTYLSKGTFNNPKKDAQMVKQALISNAKSVTALTLTVLPPLQAINFIYVPLHLRVVFLCAVDFFYTTGVSLIANRNRQKQAPQKTNSATRT